MGTDRLAIEGGGKASENLGPFPTKIGKDELLEVRLALPDAQSHGYYL